VDSRDWGNADANQITPLRGEKEKGETGKKPEIREYKTRFQDLMEVITPRLADGTMSVSDGLVRQVLESIVR
jgi:hypothetical protein